MESTTALAPGVRFVGQLEVATHYSQRRYRKVELERSAVPVTKYRLGCGSGWCGNHVGSLGAVGLGET